MFPPAQGHVIDMWLSQETLLNFSSCVYIRPGEGEKARFRQFSNRVLGLVFDCVALTNVSEPNLEFYLRLIYPNTAELNLASMSCILSITSQRFSDVLTCLSKMF